MPESIPFHTIAVSYLAVLFSLCVHEWAHAASAYWMGDSTAKDRGRMTLNPLAHMDILGTLVLPLVGMATGARVLGWAKPVPVDPSRLSRRFSQKTGMAMVAGAGPGSNIVLSFFCVLALGVSINAVASGAGTDVHKGTLFWDAVLSSVENFSVRHHYLGWGQTFFMTLLGKMVIINIGLAIFNLLPFGPLDGASIIRGFLPWRMLPGFDRAQPVLTVIVLIAFFTGHIMMVLGPIFEFAINFFILPLAKWIMYGFR